MQIFPSSQRESRHSATPTVVSPRNNVWETNAEIPYWWRVTTQTRVVLLIGRAAREMNFNQSEPPPRNGYWQVISMEFLRSFLRRHFRDFAVQTSQGGIAKCRFFFSQVISPTGSFWRQSKVVRNNQQSKLLNEAEYMMWRITQIGECLRNLHQLILRIIRLRKPNTLIVLLLIQSISEFLTTLPPRRFSLKQLPISLGSVSEYSLNGTGIRTPL